MRELWEKFDRGDSLTTSELQRLLKCAKGGEAYLEARGEQLACFKTRFDITRIKGTLRARGVHG